MLEHLQRTIEELKVKVKNNVESINKNQDSIKRMMNDQSQEEYAGQYEVFNQKNKDLLAQNNDLINVQLTLINFIDKYKDTAVLHNEVPLIDIYSITDAQEVFALTIKGIIPFNDEHPFYNQSSFIDKLIVYYESAEDYEHCQELIKLKEEIFN